MLFQKSADNPAGAKASDLLYKKFNTVFIFAYVLLLCKAMVSCYRIKEFSYISIFILFIIGILLYKLYSLLRAKAVQKTAVFLLPFLLLLLLLNLRHLVPLWDIYILQNFNSINLGIYNESETYFHQFLPFLIVFIPFTTASCFILSAKGNSELSLVIFSLYMFSFWNNGLDKLLSGITPFFIVLSLLYFSFCRYGKTMGRFRDTNIKVNISFRNIFLYTVLSTGAIILLVSGAVHLFGSKSIVQLRSDYEINEAWMTNSSKKSLFDLANTGYGSNNGRLGGPIQLDTLIAIKVKADYPAYLRGSVKDYYDGHSWSKSTDEYTMLGTEQLTEPTQEFNLLMTGTTKEKPGIRKMSLYHYGLATSTLFSPANTLDISAKDGKVMYNTSNILMLLGKKTVSAPYTLKYYFSETGVENFEILKKSRGTINYESNSTASEKAEYYRNNIINRYKPYLQVPQSVSPRTYELVKNILAGSITTEDKVERILNYLSRSYPYSLNVSQVPEDTDFIDYFLFNEKKGYCTYFASAATIMLRIAGIPSRYVEGFNMDGERDSSGLYLVRNHRAHAWTEILVAPESNLWCIADCVPQGAQTGDISSSEQYKDRFDDDRYKSGDSRFMDMISGERNSFNLRYYDSLLSILFYPLLIVPAALLLLLSAYILYRLAIFNGRINKILKQESNIPFYIHLTSRLKTIGESFPEECCELEYVKNMKDKELSIHLEKVVEACYLECYGGIGGSALIDKRACNRIIERHIRKKSGFIKYWYCIIRRN